VNLRRLHYFVTVAEELHFGRAAERLHIAQPPLSQQIRRLETELNVELLRRNRRRVQLTDAGRLLLERARPLLAEADRIEDLLRQAGAGEVGRLRIGFVGTASYATLPAILRAFHERFPEVELDLEELTTGPQVAALNAGHLDVGLVRPPVEDPSLRLTPLVQEELLAALPDSHPLARLASVPVQALAPEPFILFLREHGTGLYDDIITVCRQAGFSPTIVQETNDTQTIVSLVSAGLGVALLPASIANFPHPRVVYKPLRGPNASLEIALAEHRLDPSPLVTHFRAVAQDVTGVSSHDSRSASSPTSTDERD
jgi:DNA-binding transcriptional LysR family regulator